MILCTCPAIALHCTLTQQKQCRCPAVRSHSYLRRQAHTQKLASDAQTGSGSRVSAIGSTCSMVRDAGAADVCLQLAACTPCHIWLPCWHCQHVLRKHRAKIRNHSLLLKCWLSHSCRCSWHHQTPCQRGCVLPHADSHQVEGHWWAVERQRPQVCCPACCGRPQ